jgi:hypothetical protein
MPADRRKVPRGWGRRLDPAPSILDRKCRCGCKLNDHSPATGACYYCACLGEAKKESR